MGLWYVVGYGFMSHYQVCKSEIVKLDENLVPIIKIWRISIISPKHYMYYQCHEVTKT
jgi:hypothetical protein